MDPLAFLFSLERLGMKFGLQNMATLCAALGHPQRAFQSAIIGGTNGKGSVTAMASRALHAAGHHVARYTSPHLERLEERFVIAEQPVEPGDLREAAGTIQGVVERLLREGDLDDPPTFFECATAIAFELFRRRGVTLAILEVGLGGRLDATNIVSPIAAAITSIDFDHQAQLGNTLTAIAEEKAGIIKPGIPVVCGPLPSEAEQVMIEACRARGARLIQAAELVVIDADHQDGTIDLRSRSFDLRRVRLALAGRHQLANAAVTVCLLEEVASLGFAVAEAAVVSGLSGADWPARLERRTWRDAELLFDAAHNPAGARALASYLDETGWSGATLVFGAMKDKDVPGILAPLLPQIAHLICTTAASPRALPAVELAALAETLSDGVRTVVAIDDPAAALAAACRPGARVVVAGSIFLVGPLRGILR